MSVNRLSRRSFLAAAASVTGFGLVGCSAGAPQASSIAATGSDNSSDFAGNDGDGGSGDEGGDHRGSGTGLNSEINVIKSELTLPEPFQIALPVPAQLVARQTTDTDYYAIVQSVSRQEIVPGYNTTIWGYNGTFPGPTIVSASGRQTVVNHTNRSWKDTVFLRDNETVDLAAQFNGFAGRYMFHCHNLEHEDMAMMANFEIVD